MTPILALIATIPPRAASCARLLRELAAQTTPPGGVILCLDGYGAGAAPDGPLPVVAAHRTDVRQGPGGRWRAALALPSETLVVAIDDDCVLARAPRFVESLVAVAGPDGAAAAAGLDVKGRRVYPGDPARGALLYGIGCGLTVRVRHLAGLADLAARMRDAEGVDPLGPLGDDDALVSAHLWRTAVRLGHAPTGVFEAAPGTATSSQTRARAARGDAPDAQKHALRRVAGWPWPSR